MASQPSRDQAHTLARTRVPDMWIWHCFCIPMDMRNEQNHKTCITRCAEASSVRRAEYVARYIEHMAEMRMHRYTKPTRHVGRPFLDFTRAREHQDYNLYVTSRGSSKRGKRTTEFQPLASWLYRVETRQCHSIPLCTEQWCGLTAKIYASLVTRRVSTLASRLWILHIYITYDSPVCVRVT